MDQKFYFRTAEEADIPEISEIEQICFPPNEACQPEHMTARIQAAPELCLLLINRETEEIAGFLNGIATEENVFRDEFFTDSRLHDPAGKQVMLLGLDVRPAYRHQGLAGRIVREYQKRCRDAGKKALILTCHDHLVGFYAGFGFQDLGLSSSVWGGEVWHDMIYTL